MKAPRKRPSTARLPLTAVCLCAKRQSYQASAGGNVYPFHNESRYIQAVGTRKCFFLLLLLFLLLPLKPPHSSQPPSAQCSCDSLNSKRKRSDGERFLVRQESNVLCHGAAEEARRRPTPVGVILKAGQKGSASQVTEEGGWKVTYFERTVT